MFDKIGRARGTDFFRIADQLTDAEREVWQTARRFVDHEVLPVINDYWERAEFPRELIAKHGKTGLVGDGIQGYGCPELSPIANGLIQADMAALHTYEGTETIQTLIVGRDITGVSAFV
jgi:glutaryl-CoA dehydrogenase